MKYRDKSPYFFCENVSADEEVITRLKEMIGYNGEEFALIHCEVECTTPCKLTVNEKSIFTFDENHQIWRFPYPIFQIVSLKFNKEITPNIAFAC